MVTGALASFHLRSELVIIPEKGFPYGCRLLATSVGGFEFVLKVEAVVVELDGKAFTVTQRLDSRDRSWDFHLKIPRTRVTGKGLAPLPSPNTEAPRARC